MPGCIALAVWCHAPVNDKRRRSFILFALLLFVGINLRSIILAVPPVLPLIKHDLNLSYTATGLLTSMPILIMGATAWSSGLLVERIGERNAVTFGLILLAGGSLLRALWPVAFPLFFFTVLLSLGIALTQTTIPVLVRRWFPAHIGLATALFTDGLIIGETLGAGATVPIMLGFLGKGAWVATFVFWGLPVVVLLPFWLWIASYNQALHYANLTPLAPTILNASQIPSSLLVTFFAQRMTGRRWPFVLAGFVCIGAMLG